MTNNVAINPFFKPTFEVSAETFTEKNTGLEWAKSVPSFRNFAAAVKAAAACRTGGHADWRLPTRRELETLIDLDSAGPATFPELRDINSTDDWYFTCSEVKGYAGCVWFVLFSYGDVRYGSRNYSGLARFVRGGAAGPSQ